MDEYRPVYHCQPKQNWMNDPNGLMQHEGLYHLYYQYNPHGDQWGDIHWGHAVSTDLIHWEQHPVAMKPEAGKGELHCFSGCGFKNAKGEPMFYYTSIGAESQGRGGKDGAEQWLAIPSADMDALTQTDTHAMRLTMHAGMQVQEWRDPYVLPYKDGYLMVLGCRLENKGGACLLYTSDNGMDFTYHSVLAMDETGKDYTWECPNFFRLDDRYVLIYSPDYEPQYIIGDLTDDLRFVPTSRGTLDTGGWEGFYAPQSFEDEAGRRIVFGWMPERAREDWQGIQGWNGCQSLPRELYIEGDVLKMRVVSEVRSIMHEACKGVLPVAKLSAGRQFALTVEATLEADGLLKIDLLQNAAKTLYTRVTVAADGHMTLNREHSTDYPGVHKGVFERELAAINGKVRLEIYVDHSTVEVGCNGQWMSARVYPSDTACADLTIQATNVHGSYAFYQMSKTGK